MSREASKKAAKELLALCEAEGVKMPTNPINAMVEAGTMLNSTREDGEFQLQKALAELITKFGQKEGAAPAASKKRKASDVKKETKSDATVVIDEDDDADARDKKSTTTTTTKKRKAATATKKPVKKKAVELSDEEEDDDEPKAKKARGKPAAAHSANQALADAFAELSGFEFKRGEKFKGGTWSKVAKAVRDAESAITSGKLATKLKGIGKSSAAKIDEFLETGTMVTLEEYRAGNM
ncbi:hypothetical protein PybrP1_003188 [[Pythium] brassicae (nom. inval.)]|nr:hypothetical protein PybrP1_003188 [[Pythium] brassicae (nom. inval.)]